MIDERHFHFKNISEENKEISIPLQILILLASSFIYAVLTAYTVYRYFVAGSEYIGAVAIADMNWNILYSIYTMLIIYAGSTLKRKVRTKSN